MSKAALKAEMLAKEAKKVLDIDRFSGEHFDKFVTGMLVDSNNVCVLPGGALTSMFSDSRVDVSVLGNIAGVYTFCGDCDPEYETQVTPEWVYENVCPEDLLGYEKWQLNESRLLIKDVGMPAKTASGYRHIVGAFSDGEYTYVFYDAVYSMIDERRQAEYMAFGRGYMYKFFSGKDGDYVGSVDIYTLSQMFLDVIDSEGNIATSLVTADLKHIERIDDEKYKYSMLISTDGENFRYASADYAPQLGIIYTVYFDRVYTDLYSVLDTDYPLLLAYSSNEKRIVRYCNSGEGIGTFGKKGEKILVMPDMRLLERSGREWGLSEAKSDTMPKLSAAVQYFSRLFGIYGDTVYASVSGDCSDFTEADENEPTSGAWHMVTEDAGGFTAITAFDGKVIVFTKQRMMTVRNVELPFALSQVGNCGCVSQEALASVGENLYFISQNGVMSYSGGGLKRIDGALPCGVDYSMASLTAANDTLVLYLGDRGEVWFYEEASGEWSRRGEKADGLYFAGETALISTDGGYSLYRLFDEFGDFSFKIAIANGGRRRIKSISVTASVGFDSELILVDGSGNPLMGIAYPENIAVTRTYYPRMMYTDSGVLSFIGRGECTLYRIRIEYASLPCVARRII